MLPQHHLAALNESLRHSHGQQKRAKTALARGMYWLQGALNKKSLRSLENAAQDLYRAAELSPSAEVYAALCYLHLLCAEWQGAQFYLEQLEQHFPHAAEVKSLKRAQSLLAKPQAESAAEIREEQLIRECKILKQRFGQRPEWELNLESLQNFELRLQVFHKAFEQLSARSREQEELHTGLFHHLAQLEVLLQTWQSEAQRIQRLLNLSNGIQHCWDQARSLHQELDSTLGELSLLRIETQYETLLDRAELYENKLKQELPGVELEPLVKALSALHLVLAEIPEKLDA